MASRGMQLGGDLDNLAYASQDEFDAMLKKFCATKNCKPEAAIRWALQRAMTEADRQFIQSKFDELYKSGASLI
ncbi:MAG: hypothetical protein O3C63_03135 [Cyanobacteria bacterium]|nr:hypothetical protein [Cyanobacteriota bacterium]MDA1020889.1 hypothetical protein [Cyanobacteriota bacterium]